MCPVLILTVAFWLMFGARQLVFALHIHLPLAANQSQLVTTDQSTVTVPFVITKLPRFTSKQANRYHLQIKVADEEVARFDGPNDSNDPTRSIWFDQAALNRDLHQLHPDAIYESTFGLKGQRVGFTHVQLRLLRLDSRTDQVLSTAESNAVDVLVTRPQQNRWSTIFTIAVIILVNLNNINMGCALDMAAIKQTLARPVAPLIGLCSQYVFMPLLAFAIGAILLPDVPYLRFGLFVFGCSPGGSASNMWSVLLKGNLNLSITMTLISTFTAMAMMPAWLFTLGRFAFNQPGLHVPYRNIVGTLASMSFCLAIGLSIQRYFPKLAQVSRVNLSGQPFHFSKLNSR